jgi:hypothetical protein
MFVITKTAERGPCKGMTLFLVDRKHVKTRWWSFALCDAIIYHKEAPAKFVAGRLKHGEIDVLTYREARKVDAEQLHDLVELSEHPLDMDSNRG